MFEPIKIKRKLDISQVGSKIILPTKQIYEMFLESRLF
jgi:hypothetical protein